ncbi:MAG: C45 family autoproteolytic acyltransferase/hydrolase [Acidimicrobiia bacterium]
MGPLTRLIVEGSAATVGSTHGTAFASDIRRYAVERARLSAVGTDLDRSAIVDIADEMLPAHETYDPELYEEMLAMAEAADISPGEAVIVGGYTDFIDAVRAVAGGTAFEDTCTAMITPDASSEGAGFLAQTWDMHASATPHVFLLDVAVNDRPRALVFTTHGTLGQIGMNDAGITIGINNLTVTDGALGVTWPFVVRKALNQRSFEAALACILDAPLAGGHNFLLLDAGGNGASIEATPTQHRVERLRDVPLVHTNHCLAPNTQSVQADRPVSLMRSSTDRMSHATSALAQSAMASGSYTSERLMELLRDERSICRHPDPEYGYESSGAVVARPRTGGFWACWGIPSENTFEHFTFNEK